MNDSKPKILIVDDEPDFLTTITDILEDSGYDVCGVDHGCKAVEMASRETFALAFIDLNLPDMHGVEAYRQIRTISPETVVIMMTGYSVESLIKQAMELGAYSVLYKPLNVEVLLNSVKDILDAPCVLVVDDEPAIRESVRLIFEDLGYRVALASDGYQAVNHVESNHYDVILMDVAMPGIDGFETCRRIVEHDPSAKVVFITAYNVDQCAQQAMTAGALTLMSKPVEPGNMVDLVNSLVGSRTKAVLSSG
ncbi:MAG: response regulator [Chloroflexi bacterium]|nr:response regulator [Chloroflexota bacterium]MDA1271096.1 response regulator [Chloroflexota bacterium]PKB58577.1 MAG: hypothetical protein BZY83_06250 [SAR202 cluster bacterium Casp-Chloro-G2]